jgi:hypothetical protein
MSLVEATPAPRAPGNSHSYRGLNRWRRVESLSLTLPSPQGSGRSPACTTAAGLLVRWM